jgi:outer membrane protein
MNRIVFTLLITFTTIFSLSAQKFGYVNSSQLLISLPEVKTADASLEAYQKELITKGEQMVKKFETSYSAYMEKVNSGELSKLQMQQQEAGLSQEQQTIQSYEVEVQQKLAAKKQELYQPILNKVQDLVDQVGKENGYTMIFDASIGGILFAEDGDDLMPMLKQKLGVQ